MRAPPALIAATLLAACATPQLDVPGADAIARADYPELRPIGQILARAEAQAEQITPGTTSTLRARATNLQARAALMRRSALTDADRDRLRAALQRLRARTS